MGCATRFARFTEISLVSSAWPLSLSQIQGLIPPAEGPFMFLQMMQCDTQSAPNFIDLWIPNLGQC